MLQMRSWRGKDHIQEAGHWGRCRQRQTHQKRDLQTRASLPSLPGSPGWLSPCPSSLGCPAQRAQAPPAPHREYACCRAHWLVGQCGDQSSQSDPPKHICLAAHVTLHLQLYPTESNVRHRREFTHHQDIASKFTTFKSPSTVQHGSSTVVRIRSNGLCDGHCSSTLDCCGHNE